MLCTTRLRGFGQPGRLLLAALLLGGVACGQAPQHPIGVDDADAVDADASPGVRLAPSASADGCVGVDVAAEPLPVDLFAVVDSSSSMSDATLSGVSKWYATKAAFRDFLQQAPAGMGFGLSLFPLPDAQTASCFAADYERAAMPIGDVSRMADGALAELDAVSPRGQTPTAPALTAALGLATRYAEQHRERSVVVVLATDGLPTTCAPTDALALAELAQAALRGPGHVRTLVVASKPLPGSAEQRGFESIALAGGSGAPLVIDPHAEFAQQLGKALQGAAERQVACDLALPEPPATQRLDYDAVNVVLTSADQSLTFPRVDGPADCAAAGGWYYDVDPALGAPSRLNMCKGSCDRLADVGSGKLSVELGCKTRVR